MPAYRDAVPSFFHINVLTTCYFSSIVVVTETPQSSLGSGRSCSGRLKHYGRDLCTRWDQRGGAPTVHGLKVMLTFWTYFKKKETKERFWAECDMIWFVVSKRQLLLLCDGWGVGGKRGSKQDWKEKLETGALTWVRGDGFLWMKALLVDCWVPFNLCSPWTQWFLTHASRLWPQSPSLIYLMQRTLPPPPPYCVVCCRWNEPLSSLNTLAHSPLQALVKLFS